MTATKIGSSTFPRSACSPLTMCLVSTVKTALPKSPKMGRWAKELPVWAEKFKTATTITAGDTHALYSEMSKLGDRYLATTYLELPTPYKMSIYADFLEAEIISRFCDQNAIIPPLVLVDD